MFVEFAAIFALSSTVTPLVHYQGTKTSTLFVPAILVSINNIIIINAFLRPTHALKGQLCIYIICT